MVHERIQVVLRHNAGINEAANAVEPLLAAVEAALGGGHHLASLLLGDVLAIHGAAQHRQLLGVAQSVFSLFELHAREGAGFDQGAQALDVQTGAEHVGVFGLGIGKRNRLPRQQYCTERYQQEKTHEQEPIL